MNCGLAYVGNVGGEGTMDFTALGDTVNVAARLAENAGAGEVLLSEDAYAAAGLGDLERRSLGLRGKDAQSTSGCSSAPDSPRAFPQRSAVPEVQVTRKPLARRVEVALWRAMEILS